MNDFPDRPSDQTAEPKLGPGENLAACAAGALVLGVAGVIVGRLTAPDWAHENVLIGLGIGVVVGLILGRPIALFRTVLGGAAFGAFLPIGMILIDAVRRGRLKEIRLQDFQEPQFWLIVGGAVGGGAVVGGLLVATRKLILHAWGRGAGG